jgi:hypothetical protein
VYGTGFDITGSKSMKYRKEGSCCNLALGTIAAFTRRK